MYVMSIFMAIRWRSLNDIHATMSSRCSHRCTVTLERSVHTDSEPWVRFAAGGCETISASLERRRVQSSAQQLDLTWPKPNSSTQRSPRGTKSSACSSLIFNLTTMVIVNPGPTWWSTLRFLPHRTAHLPFVHASVWPSLATHRTASTM